MHFLVFIPGTRSNAGKALRDVGLPTFAPEAEELICEAGPGGGEVGCITGGMGLLIGWRRNHRGAIAYEPDRQTWRSAIAAGDRPAGRYQVGVWNDDPPTPHELVLRDVRGLPVRLADGHEWYFPVISTISTLPMRSELDDDGRRSMVLDPEHARLADEADHWRRTFADPELGRGDFSEIVDFLVRCLQVNHRLPVEVVALLNLFDVEAAKRALFAVIGGRDALESLKGAT